MVDYNKLIKAIIITFGILGLMAGFIALVLWFPIIIGIITIIGLLCFLVYLVYIEL